MMQPTDETPVKPENVKLIHKRSYSPIWRRVLVALGFKRFAKSHTEYFFVHEDGRIGSRTE